MTPPADDLDALSPAELDALPYGVVQLDDAGRVTFYSAGESRLTGLAPEQALGRDFFREVAPGAHVPRFHGRFLEGVRAGALDADFPFIFGFDSGPVQVQVRMRRAAAAGRWWLTLQQVERLGVSDHRAAAEAVATVESRVRAEPVDPSVCEREPIHIPGAIQPHAVLLALDPASPDLRVDSASANIADIAPAAEPATVIGRGLAALGDGFVGLAARLEAMLAEGLLAEAGLPGRLRAALGPEGARYDIAAHLSDGRLLVELERLAAREEDFDGASPLAAQDVLTAMRRAGDVGAAAEAAARGLRALTGFQRVLVYRFDPEWNGEAIAEARDESVYEPLLGLRFPASDIPAQARALYARSPARFVVDRDAAPARLLAADTAGNATVDLSFASSRALSPVHLEYQRNLGVNGSMSLSIVVEGRLWGLMIGHHRRPHYVTPDTRALAQLVTDGFAMRVSDLESEARWTERQLSLAVQNRLLERLAAAEDLVSALTRGDATLGDLFGAAGAALLIEGAVNTVGLAPEEGQVRALADRLLETVSPLDAAWTHDRLCELWPDIAPPREVASGLLAAFIGEDRRGLLMWFRPEAPATVVWGGDPSKPVLADSVTRTVLPRRSFERWVEERRGQAAAFAPWHMEAAVSLSRGMEGVVLRQLRRITELESKQEALTAALRQKELLAREVDHRVKNSLQIVAGVMRMQARAVQDPEAQAAFEDTYARVMSVARVHDSLQQSDEAHDVDLSQTLKQLCDDLAKGIAGASRRLTIDAEPNLRVSSGDAVSLSLIATELITNALKYAYDEGEAGQVAVELQRRNEGGVKLTVCDFGRGLPPDWDAGPKQRRGGSTGLGMRVIQAMVNQLEGSLEVSRSQPSGACFAVSA